MERCGLEYFIIVRLGLIEGFFILLKLFTIIISKELHVIIEPKLVTLIIITTITIKPK